MERTEDYHNERLDHLGIVAGVCQEMGLAAWLDALAPTQQRVVSYGTATVTMILNGLGFSNRQLYLVLQLGMQMSDRIHQALFVADIARKRLQEEGNLSLMRGG